MPELGSSGNAAKLFAVAPATSFMTRRHFPEIRDEPNFGMKAAAHPALNISVTVH
jgi:hypothetical protein